MKIKIMAAVVMMGLTGCATLGPRIARQAQYPYNEALVHSWKEQMLLNLVRLRYRDNPYFLEVASVTSSHTIGANAAAGLSFPGLSTKNEQSAGVGLSYGETPTISYNPLTGGDFVKRMLSKVSTKRLIALAQSGWSIERVLNICVQRINGLDNAAPATGPTPDQAPDFRDYVALTHNLRTLQRANLLTLESDPDHDVTRLDVILDPGKDHYMRIESSPEHESVVAEVHELMGTSQEHEWLKFSGNMLNRDKTGRVVRMQARTLLGVLFYLSHGVDVPRQHEQIGLVTMTTDECGRPFDWLSLVGKEMIIRHSKSKPKCATIMVCYRGYWFYIDDRDLNSKSSFMLLSKLFDFQADSDGGGATPQLTLPVTG